MVGITIDSRSKCGNLPSVEAGRVVEPRLLSMARVSGAFGSRGDESQKYYYSKRGQGA